MCDVLAMYRRCTSDVPAMYWQCAGNAPARYKYLFLHHLWSDSHGTGTIGFRILYSLTWNSDYTTMASLTWPNEINPVFRCWGRFPTRFTQWKWYHWILLVFMNLMIYNMSWLLHDILYIIKFIKMRRIQQYHFHYVNCMGKWPQQQNTVFISFGTMSMMP